LLRYSDWLIDELTTTREPHIDVVVPHGFAGHRGAVARQSGVPLDRWDCRLMGPAGHRLYSLHMRQQAPEILNRLSLVLCSIKSAGKTWQYR